MSRTLGQVQFYSVNRAVNYHTWARADRGHIQRAYAWAGETLWYQGPVSQAETDLGMQCLDYGERPETLPDSSMDSPNSEKVMPLAARWSFDPSALDDTVLRAGVGVAGELSHTRQH